MIKTIDLNYFTEKSVETLAIILNNYKSNTRIHLRSEILNSLSGNDTFNQIIYDTLWKLMTESKVHEQVKEKARAALMTTIDEKNIGHYTDKALEAVKDNGKCNVEMLATYKKLIEHSIESEQCAGSFVESKDLEALLGSLISYKEEVGACLKELETADVMGHVIFKRQRRNFVPMPLMKNGWGLSFQ